MHKVHKVVLKRQVVILQDLIKASKMVTVSGLTTLKCHPTDLFLFLLRSTIFSNVL